VAARRGEAMTKKVIDVAATKRARDIHPPTRKCTARRHECSKFCIDGEKIFLQRSWA
jgi:hypothetical protein